MFVHVEAVFTFENKFNY